MKKAHANYDAFLSYASRPDQRLARAVEAYLERIHLARSPNESTLRKLEVCVDGSDFDLGQQIRPVPGETAVQTVMRLHLERSASLIVMCSSGSACSEAVDWEVQWFLRERAGRPVHLVVTEGEDPVEHPEKVFPPAVRAAGLHQRIWFDLRGATWRRRRAARKLRDFDESRLQLAAAVYGGGVTSSALAPGWYRQQRTAARRRTMLVLAASLLIAVAATLAVVFAVREREQRQRADAQSRTSESRRLAAESALALGSERPQRAVLLALEALHVCTRSGQDPPGAAETALRAALSMLGPVGREGTDGFLERVLPDPVGRGWITLARDDTLRRWSFDLSDHRELARGISHVATLDFGLFALGQSGAVLVRSAGSAPWTTQLPEWPAGSEADEVRAEGQRITVTFDDERVVAWRIDSVARRADLAIGPIALPQIEEQRRLLTAAGVSTDPSTRVFVGHAGATRYLVTDSGQIVRVDRTQPPVRMPAVPFAMQLGGSVVVSGNGETLLVTDGMRAAAVYDLRKAEPKPQLLHGHADPKEIEAHSLYEVARVSADGDILLTTDDTNALLVWRRFGAAFRATRLRGHDLPVTDAILSDDGRAIASVGEDGSIRVWPDYARMPMAAPVPVPAFEDRGIPLPWNGVDIGVSGATAFRVGAGHGLMDVSQDATEVVVRSRSAVLAADASGRFVVAGSPPMLLRPNGQSRRVEASQFAFAPTAALLVLASGHEVKVEDLASGRTRHLPDAPIEVGEIAVSDRGRVVCSSDSGAYEWTGERWRQLQIAEPASCSGLCFLGDDRLLCWSHESDFVHRLSTGTNTTLEPMSVHESFFDGRNHVRVADRHVALWNVSDNVLSRRDLPVPAQGAATASGHGDSDTWVIADGGSEVVVVQGQAIRRFFGRRSRTYALAVPDARSIVVAGVDSSLLRLAADGAIRMVRLPDSQFATAVAASAVGRWFVMCLADGSLTFHPLDLDELVRRAGHAAGRELSPSEWQRYFPGQSWRPTLPPRQKR